jgi:hypothetical protein
MVAATLLYFFFFWRCFTLGTNFYVFGFFVCFCFCPLPPDAKLKDGSLYTAGLVTRHMASLRGYLSALTRPAALEAIAQRGEFRAAG